MSLHRGLLSTGHLELGTLVEGFSLLPAKRLRLSEAEERYHAMVIGQSGSGKSKMIVNLFLQRAIQGKGSAIIEPHNDLSVECVHHLIARGFYRQRQQSRQLDPYSQVVYLDWGNGSFVPWNVLAKQTPGLTDEDVAKQVLAAFVRVWPELETSSPNFSSFIRYGVSILLANNLPLTSLLAVLQKRQLRQGLMPAVSNPAVHDFFDWYDTLSPRDASAELASTAKRISEIEYDNVTRLTFGQPTTAVNLRQLMDEGRSVIINLGNINDSALKRFIGAIVLKQVEQAAFSRRDIQPESQRRHFVTFVDEFPTIAGQDKSIQEMLSQARKFRLTLYLATQTLSNIDIEGMRASLENCRLKITFGLGHNSAVIQAREIGEVDPMVVKEAPQTDSQHALFLGVQEQLVQWENQFKNLKPQQCFVKMGNRPPVKVKASDIPEPKVDAKEAEEVFGEYKRRYQMSKADAEAAIVAHAKKLALTDQLREDTYSPIMTKPPKLMTSS